MPICPVKGCGNDVFCKGLCRSHDNKRRYAENRGHHQERSRRWYAANPEKAAARRAQLTPEQVRIYAKAWYWADRIRGVVTAANARAKKVGALGRLTADGVRARFAYFGDRCWICREPGADSIDHVIPLGAGGPNFNSNIRPAHLGCNAARSWEGRRPNASNS